MSAASAAGLLVDVFGASVLALALARRSGFRTLVETQARHDFSAPLHASFAKQTADAQVGTALLALGFVGQFFAAVGVDSRSIATTAASTAAGGLIGGVAVLYLLLHLRPLHVKRAMRWQLTRRRREPSIWQLIIDAYALEIGIRRKNESPANLARRLLGDAYWAWLTRGVDVPPAVMEEWHATQQDPPDESPFTM